MDQRVHPEEILGLNTGDIPVIRNAGGTAKNAVLDITVLDTIIQITEIVVIHHTSTCAMYLSRGAVILTFL
jgi:carbonic anhydrase